MSFFEHTTYFKIKAPVSVQMLCSLLCTMLTCSEKSTEASDQSKRISNSIETKEVKISILFWKNIFIGI